MKKNILIVTTMDDDKMNEMSLVELTFQPMMIIDVLCCASQKSFLSRLKKIKINGFCILTKCDKKEKHIKGRTGVIEIYLFFYSLLSFCRFCIKGVINCFAMDEA